MPVLPIGALDGLLLVHVPPGVGLLNVVVLPAHIMATPVIAAGGGVTVTVVTEVQPPKGNLYEIKAVPGEIPVTIPELMPTPAVPGLPLDHAPPLVALLNEVVAPMH